MNLLLLFQYILSLIAVLGIFFGLSRIKKALLIYCRKLQKPPSTA